MDYIKNSTGSNKGDEYINKLLDYLKKDTTSIELFIRKIKVIDRKNSDGLDYFPNSFLSDELVDEILNKVSNIKNIETSEVKKIFKNYSLS